MTFLPVEMRNGSISFQSDEYIWQGTVDQRVGQITIPHQGIRRVGTGALSRHGLSVTGNYRDAIVNSGLCGTGFFQHSEVTASSPMTAHPRHALPIGRLIYGYQIVRMIGQGGFGSSMRRRTR